MLHLAIGSTLYRIDLVSRGPQGFLKLNLPLPEKRTFGQAAFLLHFFVPRTLHTSFEVFQSPLSSKKLTKFDHQKFYHLASSILIWSAIPTIVLPNKSIYQLVCALLKSCIIINKN